MIQMRLNHRKKICYPAFATFEKPPKKKKTRSGWKFWFLAGFFILALAGAVYFLLFSPVFKIKEIKISGNDLVATEKIQAAALPLLQTKNLKLIPADNFFVLSSQNFKDKIFESFAEIEKVEIKKMLPGKLEILIVERQPAAIYCQAGIEPTLAPAPSATSLVSRSPSAKEKNKLPESEKCFFLDESGIIYREAPKISGSLMPIFYYQGEQSLGLRTPVVASSTIFFASQAKKELRNSNIDLAGFLIKGLAGLELSALTEEGWFIYFDTNRSAVVQAKVLEALLENEIKQKRTNLEYVDLRVANRVYYRQGDL